MSEETPPPTEAAPEPEDQPTCAVCSGKITPENQAYANEQLVCLDCRDQILAELQAEQAGAGSTPMGLAGAVLGAGLGAVIWAGIVIVTDFEVGFVAILVGWLAGKGAVIAAGGKKGSALQLVAVLGAVLGLFLGKYLTVAHVIKTEVAEFADRSYFDTEIITLFIENAGDLFGGFDILWLILAVGIAWKTPKPTEITVSMLPGDG